MHIILRNLEDADLDSLFAWERDRQAVALAAFTRSDPSDRAAFDAHYRRIRKDGSVTLLAIDDGAGLVGSIGSFTIEGDREITYWIDPAHWGNGIATAALASFLLIEAVRPLFARVAAHNHGSAAVLQRNGFQWLRSETSYAQGPGRDILEHIYRLAS